MLPRATGTACSAQQQPGQREDQQHDADDRQQPRPHVAGAFAQQFIVTAALPRLVTFLAGTIVHAAVFMGLYAVLDIRTFESPWRTIAGQALGNAVVGMIALMVIDAVPGVVERRRMARRSRH